MRGRGALLGVLKLGRPVLVCRHQIGGSRRASITHRSGGRANQDHRGSVGPLSRHRGLVDRRTGRGHHRGPVRGHRATRPARLSETMRRVRLEKLSAKKNWPARRSQPSSRCQPRTGGPSMATPSSARDAETPSAFRLGSGCVRSSNGQNCRLFSMAPLEDAAPYPTPDRRRRQLTISPRAAIRFP